MKDKKRNLERFVGITLNSTFEESLGKSDYYKMEQNYLIKTKDFQEQVFRNFSLDITEKYNNLKKSSKEELFENGIPENTEDAITIFKQNAYNKLKEMNNEVTTDGLGIANRRELELFLYKNKKNMLLTDDEKKEILDEFKEKIFDINLEEFKKITVYDSIKENFDKVNPFILTEVNKEKTSNEKAVFFINNSTTSIKKMELILNTIQYIGGSEKDLVNINRSELVNNNLKDTIVEEIAKFNTPIIRNINVQDYDFNTNIKDKIKEIIEPALEKASQNTSLITDNLKELYVGIGMELNLTEEVGFINHDSQIKRMADAEKILEKNYELLNFDEKATELIYYYKKEFNEENYKRDNNEYYFLKTKMMASYKFEDVFEK